LFGEVIDTDLRSSPVVWGKEPGPLLGLGKHSGD